MQCLEELAYRLRREDGSRFIQNEELRLSHQCAKNLDALTLTHREFHHNRGGIHLQTVLFTEQANFTFDLCSRNTGRKTKRYIFRNRKRIEKREMLVHHCDAEFTRLCRGFNAERMPVKRNFALVWTGGTVDDFHQGGLARAVLAEDGEHLTGRNIKRYMIVCCNARIALRNVAKA